MRDRLVALRRRLDPYPVATWIYRLVIAVAGVGVLILGIIMLPAPGPGWVVIFAGLGILATEFVFARRVLQFVRRKYEQWVEWLKRQTPLVRALVSVGLLLVTAVCVWAVGAFALMGSWVGINWPWLQSPLARLF